MPFRALPQIGIERSGDQPHEGPAGLAHADAAAGGAHEPLLGEGGQRLEAYFVAAIPVAESERSDTRSLARFVEELQLVPDQFWYWQDPDEQFWDQFVRPDGPTRRHTALPNREQFIALRERVWRERIYPAWRGARGRITGLSELTVLTEWSLANVKRPPARPDDPDAQSAEPVNTLEEFRRRRRGRVLV